MDDLMMIKARFDSRGKEAGYSPAALNQAQEIRYNF